MPDPQSAPSDRSLYVSDANDTLLRLGQIGWVLDIEADGGNSAFWWFDGYPEPPAAGVRPVYVIEGD